MGHLKNGIYRLSLKGAFIIMFVYHWPGMSRALLAHQISVFPSFQGTKHGFPFSKGGSSCSIQSLLSTWCSGSLGEFLSYPWRWMWLLMVQGQDPKKPIIFPLCLYAISVDNPLGKGSSGDTQKSLASSYKNLPSRPWVEFPCLSPLLLSESNFPVNCSSDLWLCPVGGISFLMLLGHPWSGS